MVRFWLSVFLLLSFGYSFGQVGIPDSTMAVNDSGKVTPQGYTITDLFILAGDSTVADSTKMNNPFYSDVTTAQLIDSLPVTIVDSSIISFPTAGIALNYAIDNNVSLDSAFNIYSGGFDEGFGSSNFNEESPYPYNVLIQDRCNPNDKFKVRDVFELDIKCVYDSIYMLNTSSILAIMDVNDLVEENDSFVFDTRVILGTRFNLCTSERHYNQPSIAFGTAFKMDSNMVLTAGHCLSDVPIENIRFIVGYEFTTQKSEFKIRICKDRVYRVKKVIKIGDTYDYAYIQTDRIISNRAIPSIKNESKSKINNTIHSVGYPLGLPMKIIGNGKVISRITTGSLKVSIDAYRGNSGSPIFDTLTGELIGMLIGGDADLVKSSSCNRLKRCLPKKCSDEIVLDINVILNDIYGK